MLCSKADTVELLETSLHGSTGIRSDHYNPSDLFRGLSIDYTGSFCVAVVVKTHTVILA